MPDFFSAAASFVSSIAAFFELQIPYIHITFFQFFAAVLIIRVILAAIEETKDAAAEKKSGIISPPRILPV